MTVTLLLLGRVTFEWVEAVVVAVGEWVVSLRLRLQSRLLELVFEKWSWCRLGLGQSPFSVSDE